MTKIKTLIAGVSALALLTAIPAFALAVSTSVDGSYYVGTNATTTTDVNVGVSGQGSTNSSANGNSNTSASSSDSASSNATADLSVPLVITRADVDGATVTASNVSAANVQTKSDLSGYIAAQMQGDANLAAVDTASDHVAVTYPEQAKLFGFIPVTINTTATTDAGGNVSITQPWWSFLAAADQTALQASVQSSVSGVLGANASANAQLTASQQARLVAAIKSAMAATAATNVTANASTSGTVGSY